MEDWFTTIARVDTDEDFLATDNRSDLFATSRIHSLPDWDLILDGHLPDLAPEWLSDAKIEQIRQERHRQGQKINAVSNKDADRGRLSLDISVPEGSPLDDESLGSNSNSEDEVEDTDTPERRYPCHATRGRLPAQYQEYPYVVGVSKQHMTGDKE
eukprot:1305991-Ditylum_brightwellii.AAC.2